MSSPAAGTLDHPHDATTSTGIPNKKLFMWAFLASDCMFFGSLISVHLIYRLHPPVGSPLPKDIFSIELTSFSTFILLMSSLLMALAVNAVQKADVKLTRLYLLGTIFFGAIFLGCQVYEFDHFVKDRGLTLNSSILGSTFYTLTGTHGCHVAIGVLWLVLMYIRTFKPANGDTGATPWLAKGFLHLVVFAAAIVLSTAAVLAFVHVAQAQGLNFGAVQAFVGSHLLLVLGTLASFVGLKVLAGSSGPVDFGAANAMDVESMGLYWHFVDIVWIVIFTVVYLIEYL
jgi:cytochrome o ubiquinol oxidase subunit III